MSVSSLTTSAAPRRTREQRTADLADRADLLAIRLAAHRDPSLGALAALVAELATEVHKLAVAADGVL